MSNRMPAYRGPEPYPDDDDHMLGFHADDPQDDCSKCVFIMKAGERSRNPGIDHTGQNQRQYYEDEE